MRPNVRRILHWGGSTLALIGVLFVILRLHTYWHTLDFSKISVSNWCVIVGIAIIYGAANQLLVLAWRNLLLHFHINITRLVTTKIYGISQLAKYVPGNIFHFAGRQALGMARDIPARILVQSTFWELILLAIAGSLFGLLILPLLIPGISPEISFFIFFFVVACALGLLKKSMSSHAAVTFALQLIFLFISGMLFVLLLHLMASNKDITRSNWLAYCGAYIISWLAGFVTPGAPAGVGIREMVLLFLLKGSYSESELLLTILIGRFVTVTGDLLFFLTASCIPENHKNDKIHD